MKHGEGKTQMPQSPRNDLIPFKDIPMSLPVQCTEDMATEEGERPPGSPQKCSEAPEGSAHPLVQPHAADVPGFDSSYPPSAPNGSVFDGGAGRAALAVAFGSNKAERSEKMDLDTWLKNCRMPPVVNSPEEGVRACCSPQEFVAPNAEAVDSFLTLLDLYKGPEALQKEDAPSESAPAAEEKVPVEIRGPVKVNREAGRDFCLGVLPALPSATASANLHHPLHQPGGNVGSSGRAEVYGYVLKRLLGTHLSSFEGN